jgi:hypothetical protein
MTKQKLLIIEPDEAYSQMLDTYFTVQGYDVQMVMNVHYAILLLRYFEPDAVLLAQEGEESRILPRVAPIPSEENWSFANLCHLWRIPIIYLLESPDTLHPKIWDGNFFR